MKRMGLKTLGVGVFALLATQFIPVGAAPTNPPVTGEPAWDSPATRELARRACFDCHSNETRWPWYASIAPASWMIRDHVSEGRRKLNFSAWPAGAGEADEAGEALSKGEMPLWDYALLHPQARLTPQETDALAQGLAATLGTKRKDGGHGARKGDDDGDRDEGRDGRP